MSKIKKSCLFRTISLVLILTFISLDISYAYPPEHNVSNSTLATPSVLQQTPINDHAARFQQSVFFQSALIASVYDIGEYFFGNADKGVEPLPSKYAEDAMRADLGEHLGDAGTEILNIVPVEYIKKTAPDKLKSALDEIGFKGILPDEGVVFILYKKGDKKFLVQIARKDHVSSDGLPGYEWVVSDKYVVKYMPEDYEENKFATSSMTKNTSTQQARDSQVLKQVALDAKSLDGFLETIRTIRDRKGYLTTDKTFLLTGVFEYLGRTEEIYAPTEDGINARISEGRSLLYGIFQDRVQKEKFLNFAVEYQYAYTHRERLVELVNKLITHIRSDPELNKKDVIKLLDIGTAPKINGSPTAEQTLLMLKATFPDKRIEVTATDIKFPLNYTFDASGACVDSRTGIIYRKHNIIDGSLPGHDIVIGVNLLGLYKDENIRERMRTNIFGSSTAYVITGVDSKEGIWRKQISGEWRSVDTVVLMEKWYPPTVYNKIGFLPKEIGQDKLVLRRDVSVNHAFLEPLVDLIDKTKSSRYNAIFKLLTLAYIQGNLERINDSEWAFGKEVLENLKNYFPEQNEQNIIKKFIEFRNTNPTCFVPKSQLSSNPKDAMLSIRELINIYILRSNNWEEIKTKRKPVKILLLQARADTFDHIPGTQPIGLATIAACANDSAYQATLFSRLNILPDNFEELLSIPFEFKLLDFQTEGPDFSYEAYLKEYKPDIVGIRTVSVSIDEANRLAVVTRATLGKDVKILYGGIHITSLPEKTLRQNKSVVDIGFLAEAEETFPHFLLGMYTNSTPISSIPGLCYLDENGQYVETPQRQLVMSLEDHPSYIKYLDLLRNPSGYHVLTEKCIHGTIKSKMALLITSRGCPGKCTFCPTRKLWSSQHIRYQSSDRVLKEMEGYYSKGFRIFYFRDDNFTTNKKRLERICDGIIQRGWKIAWCCMSRVDTIDRELLLKMKQSGLAGIAFGVESGDEKTLEAMGKKTNLLSARKANILCREIGVNHKNYIMVGYPGEKWDSVLKTMLFLLDITIGIRRIDDELGRLSEPAPPDYTRIFNEVANDIRSGKVGLAEFLNQNLIFPEVTNGEANVTFTMPYPGSSLYDVIDKDIYMFAKIFKHGPGERRNNEEFESPVATNEMSRNEITDARNIILSLINAMRSKKIETIKSDITAVIARAMSVQYKLRLEEIYRAHQNISVYPAPEGLAKLEKGYEPVANNTRVPAKTDILDTAFDLPKGELSAALDRLTEDVVKTMPAGAVYHRINPSRYHISVVPMQDLPFDDPKNKLTDKERESIEKAVARIAAEQMSYNLKFLGLRFCTDGGVIAVFEDEGAKTELLRWKIIAECNKVCGNKISQARKKPLVSITLMRIFSNITGEDIARLKAKAEELKDLLNLGLGMEINTLSFHHETRWMHTEFDYSKEYKLGITIGEPDSITIHATQLFDLVESSLNNERAKFIESGNKVINSLVTKAVSGSAVDVGIIDRKMATAEIRQKVESAITAIKSLNKESVTPEAKTAIELLKKNLNQFEADGAVGALIVLARKAKRENQKLIIGLETDWIPGINVENSLQRQAITALMKEICSIAEALQSMGLDNVEVIRGSGSQLTGAILNEAEKTHTRMHNIVVMASANTINSNSFTALRNADENDRPFLTGIDPTELIKLYTQFGEAVSKQLYIRLASLLYMTLELAAGKEPPQSPIIVSYDKKMRILILLPKADPIDYETLKNNYAAEKAALQAA